MPGTPIGPAASPCMDTSQTFFSSMDTLSPTKLNYHRTNTARWYMAQKNNSPQKTTPLRLWTAKEQNASRASSAPSYIMLGPWITSYSSALVPSDHSRPPPHNAPMKSSIKYWIAAPLTPQMEFSIALATWSYVHILTQGSTMRARDAAEMDSTFSSLKKTPCPNGTDLC